MARDGFQSFTSDNGVSIVVHFEYGRGFEEVSIGNAWTLHEEKDFEITDAERERFVAWIMEYRSRDDQDDHASDYDGPPENVARTPHKAEG